MPLDIGFCTTVRSTVVECIRFDGKEHVGFDRNRIRLRLLGTTKTLSYRGQPRTSLLIRSFRLTTYIECPCLATVWRRYSEVFLKGGPKWYWAGFADT